MLLYEITWPTDLHLKNFNLGLPVEFEYNPLSTALFMLVKTHTKLSATYGSLLFVIGSRWPLPVVLCSLYIIGAALIFLLHSQLILGYYVVGLSSRCGFSTPRWVSLLVSAFAFYVATLSLCHCVAAAVAGMLTWILIF